jgi:hypothetical protein
MKLSLIVKQLAAKAILHRAETSGQTRREQLASK